MSEPILKNIIEERNNLRAACHNALQVLWHLEESWNNPDTAEYEDIKNAILKVQRALQRNDTIVEATEL